MDPFRFGVVAASTPSGHQWAELARQVEGLGFDTLVVPDNISFGLSPFPALAAAAAATSTLRVGTYVLANDFRHPVQVAKDAVTLALLSDGRFELGIGAGRPGSDRELAMLGRRWDPPAARVDRLAESVSIIRRLLAGETVTVTDGHYEAREASVTNQPVSVPMLMAASQPRMLRLAGAQVDIVALGTAPSATETDVAGMIRSVRDGAKGRPVELNINLMAVDGAMPRYLSGRTDPAALVAGGSVAALAGSPAQMADQLRMRRERLGITYYLVGAELMTAFAPVVSALLPGRA